MENISIPPFYVGQEVVANCNHPQGVFKKGESFKINDCYKSFCGCCWLVTIGIKARNSHMMCSNGHVEKHKSDQWEFESTRFSSKLEIKDFISMKQLAEQQLELIAAN